MIKTEEYTRNDGVILLRTYSDSGFKIRRVGTDEIYCEAIDPIDSNRIYEETNIEIEVEEPTYEELLEANNVLLGVDSL